MKSVFPLTPIGVASYVVAVLVAVLPWDDAFHHVYGTGPESNRRVARVCDLLLRHAGRRVYHGRGGSGWGGGRLAADGTARTGHHWGFSTMGLRDGLEDASSASMMGQAAGGGPARAVAHLLAPGCLSALLLVCLSATCLRVCHNKHAWPPA